MNNIVKYLEKIDRLFVKIASFTLFIMMLWIFINVILRAVFNNPINGTIEMTGEYFMVIIVYLSLSYTQKNKAHINVSLLEEKLPQKVQKIMKVITNFIVSIFIFYISYLNFLESMSYFEKNLRSSGVLDYPLAPALIIISLGLFVLGLRLIIECIYIIVRKDFMPNNILDSSNEE